MLFRSWENFALKKTTNGNLVGEYTNNKTNFLSVECAQVTSSEKKNLFEGTYRTIWIEGEKSELATLKISLQNISGQKYDLTWKSNSDITLFKEQGFIIDEILLRTYTD